MSGNIVEDKIKAMARIKQRKQFGKKYFEWTIFELFPVDENFVDIFKEKIDVISEETLNKYFFKFEDQSVYQSLSFDNEKEAMSYAKLESIQKEKSFYIIKSRFVDFSLSGGMAGSNYAYNFVGYVYKGLVVNCEKEIFKEYKKQLGYF